MQSSPRPAGPLPWLFALAVPALCFVVGAVFLPRPTSATEARSRFDRAQLGDAVSRTAPTPQVKLDATLGERIRIVGADLPTEPVKQGRGLGISFYFSPEREMDRDWQIFVHIDREGASYRIHGDHFPAGGAYPTSVWQTGEFIRDRLDKLVPIDAPPGRYDVFIGFYIGDDRLPFSGGNRSLHDGTNRVRVGQIRVQ